MYEGRYVAQQPQWQTFWRTIVSLGNLAKYSRLKTKEFSITKILDYTKHQIEKIQHLQMLCYLP